MKHNLTYIFLLIHESFVIHHPSSIIHHPSSIIHSMTFFVSASSKGTRMVTVDWAWMIYNRCFTSWDGWWMTMSLLMRCCLWEWRRLVDDDDGWWILSYDIFASNVYLSLLIVGAILYIFSIVQVLYLITTQSSRPVIHHPPSIIHPSIHPQPTTKLHWHFFSPESLL